MREGCTWSERTPAGAAKQGRPGHSRIRLSCGPSAKAIPTVTFDPERYRGIPRACLSKQEEKVYKYDPSGSIEYVIYDKDDSFQDAFKDFLDVLPEFVQASFVEPGQDTDEDRNAIEKAFLPFISASCFFKHQAFEEESEIRAINFPMTPEREKYCQSADPSYETDNRPFKSIHPHPKKGKRCPHIELFDFDESPGLPINRIIVGPHEEQDKHSDWVQQLVSGRNICVYSSKTPYAG